MGAVRNAPRRGRAIAMARPPVITARRTRFELSYVDRALRVREMYLRRMPDLWPRLSVDGALPLGPAYARALALAVVEIPARFGVALLHTTDVGDDEQMEYDFWCQTAANDDDGGYTAGSDREFVPGWHVVIPYDAGALSYREPAEDAHPLDLLLFALLRRHDFDTWRAADDGGGGGGDADWIGAALASVVPGDVAGALAALVEEYPEEPKGYHGGVLSTWLARDEEPAVTEWRRRHSAWQERGRVRIDRLTGGRPGSQANRPPELPAALSDLWPYVDYVRGWEPNPFLAADEVYIETYRLGPEVFLWSDDGLTRLIACWREARAAADRVAAARARIADNPLPIAVALRDLLADTAPSRPMTRG